MYDMFGISLVFLLYNQDKLSVNDILFMEEVLGTERKQAE